MSIDEGYKSHLLGWALLLCYFWWCWCVGGGVVVAVVGAVANAAAVADAAAAAAVAVGLSSRASCLSSCSRVTTHSPRTASSWTTSSTCSKPS